MKAILFIIVVIILGILLFQMILSKSKEKKPQNNIDTYICSDCGEQDCICHKSNDTP